jgi:hypothetical protein
MSTDAARLLDTPVPDMTDVGRTEQPWPPSRRNAPPWLAKGRQIETESAPIRYVAELVGADTDSERAIRWLIALMTLCCDPLAIALTAAASARR